MRGKTFELLSRVLDPQTELTDEITEQIEHFEFLRERIDPGPLSVSDIVNALVRAGYDPRKKIEESMNDRARAVKEETDQTTGKRGPGRPRKEVA